MIRPDNTQIRVLETRIGVLSGLSTSMLQDLYTIGLSAKVESTRQSNECPKLFPLAHPPETTKFFGSTM